MFKSLFNKDVKKKREICAYVAGSLVDIEDVPDLIFSEKMMGDGVAILPINGEVVAPVDGEIILIVETKHAFAIRTEDGIEILVHIGLETVELNGEGFNFYVGLGDKVVVGQKVVEVDIDFIKKNGKSILIPMVITNGLEKKITLQKEDFKQVKEKDKILTIKL